ncbi:MAG: radical SAM protein, partial [Candidatus Thorarchaeota archaeon]
MLNLDGHKLTHYPALVERWMRYDNEIWPITVELSPTQRCNQKCTFCAYEFLEHPIEMSGIDLLSVCHEISSRGSFGNSIQGVVFSGEGEPLLHPSLAESVSLLSKRGRKVGVMTNGTREEIVNLVQFCSWIRFSVNGASSEIYHKIHQRNDREVVWENIQKAVKRKRLLKSNCTIGVQCLLLPDNIHEVHDLAKMCLLVGVDYFVLKPFSQHPQACKKSFQTTLTGEEIRKLEG